MKKSIFFLFLTTLLACQQSEVSSLKPTNVILILTDDQGYGDVNLHGNGSIQTPFQNKLATEGIRLDNFYVSPVCAPTRASLLTGRYHYRTGTSFVTRNLEAMRSEEVTLAEVFKANNYATGCFGKWHNGAHYPENPNGQGFDTFTGFCGGHWNRYINPELEVNGKMIQTEGYISDILTDSAMAFIEKNKDQPFFTYLPYNTPHTPFIAPEKLYQKYKAQGLSDEIASTYGMIENIDDNIGRVLEKLESLQLLENTLVIFMTDNGPNFDRYNAKMKGRKSFINDGGVRVPCFFYWKDHLEGGQLSQQLTSHIDILPTLIDLLGLNPTQTLPLDGVSFADLLMQKVDTLPQRTLYTFAMNQEKFKGAVRTQQHRLTITGENDYQLTNLLEDPAEQNDLKNAFPTVAKTLYEAYLIKYTEVTKQLKKSSPIPVGYAASPIVSLPAHEGHFKGNIRYQAAHWGWCNDWFTNWTNPKDTMSWQLDVVAGGTYKVSLQYACPATSVGIPISIQSGTQQLKSAIDHAFTTKFVEDYEQVPRTVEADEQTWTTQELGVIQLKKGLQEVQLFAQMVKEAGIAEVKAVILEKSL
jgi:arylsulfatase A